jgi:two-component system NtrC family sensor kinase
MRPQQLASNIRTRITLRLAIILAVISGLLIPAAFLIPIHLSAFKESEIEQNKNEHVLLVQTLSNILSEPVWQITPEIAKRSIDVVYTDLRVAEIRVITLPDQREFISIDHRKKLQKEALNTLSRDIYHGEQVIGKVFLTMSDDILIKNINGIMLRSLMISAVSLLLSIFFILLVLQWRLVKPIKLLIEKSDKLANGELNEPIELNRMDELGHLAFSLEATRQALQQSFHELEIKNQQLLNHSGNLESTVRQRTQEIESTNKHLEAALINVTNTQNELARIDRMAALGSMVAGVAHELNTPLGNCLLVASTLSDETRILENLLNEGTMRKSQLGNYVTAAKESSKLLMRGLQQAAQLVGDFKQVAVDQSSAQRRVFKLSVVFQELAALLNSSLRKTPFTLELNIPEEIELDSYPGPLGQVFNNLVNNSIVHGLDGMEHGTITCSAHLQKDHVLIVFEDTGHGIPPNILKRIFEPFFTTKFGKGGSGLGLSITFNIITNVLGGEIQVNNQANKGARFELSIPLIAPGSQESDSLLI